MVAEQACRCAARAGCRKRRRRKCRPPTASRSTAVDYQTPSNPTILRLNWKTLVALAAPSRTPVPEDGNQNLQPHLQHQKKSKLTHCR